MKKITGLFLIFSVMSFVGKAQNDKKAEIKPIIEFVTTSHDFGKIYEGKKAVFDFIFTNKGKVPLVLSNVQPGCGCTVPDWPKEAIMPGKSSKITATYDPGAYKGVFGKGITVYSNAENSPLQLQINGIVESIPKEVQSPVKIDVGTGFQ